MEKMKDLLNGMTSHEKLQEAAAKQAAQKASKRAIMSKIGNAMAVAQYAWRTFDNIISVR